MNTNTPAMAIKNDQKSNSIKKDVICLALVVIAVFVLHAFSKNTVDQLYKAKEKNSTAASAAPGRTPVF
jgi:hypothetical protein